MARLQTLPTRSRCFVNGEAGVPAAHRFCPREVSWLEVGYVGRVPFSVEGVSRDGRCHVFVIVGRRYHARLRRGGEILMLRSLIAWDGGVLESS
jgi:hypothetical protein